MALSLKAFALSSLPLLPFSSHTNPTFLSPYLHPNFLPLSSSVRISRKHTNSFLVLYRSYACEEDEDGESISFDEAVSLFNKREYYRCHDYLEALWNRSEEPVRTLVHGILQCAVGFHHLFNQNHKGAMMELGEGLCKLRKMNFKEGPFHQFEQEISTALEFIYQTQIELAACGDDLCVTMDQSDRSYQLLGGYAAGQHLYKLQGHPSDTMYVVFCPQRSYGTIEPPRIKLPSLKATEEHLMDLES